MTNVSSPPHQLFATSPLIIIGMHRSGTSLITELVGHGGVFTGADAQGTHAESQFFLRLNQHLMHMAHAEWDLPAPVAWLLEDPIVCDAIEQDLRQRCQTAAMDDYFGTKADSAVLSTLHSEPWGWKDPRNTITLPLWLRLFPDAKVLNIVRNGAAVSSSLRAREMTRKTRFDSPARSARCLSLVRSFSLWAEYVEAAAAYCDALGARQAMTIVYEEFLDDPLQHLSEILNFAGAPASDKLLHVLCKDVDQSKGNAFMNDPSTCHFYEQCRNHPLMKRYGFHTLNTVAA